MIDNFDRSYYIGASDTRFVMGNWDTQTFRNWWDVKMGFTDNPIDNIYLRTGTAYEPRILDYLGVTERNRQIIIGRLRVNLDGEIKDGDVVEIKTARMGKSRFDSHGGWLVPKPYEQQLQVELFATQGSWGWIYLYEVDDDDYDAVSNGITLPIDPERMHWSTFYKDEKWINEEYLPRLWYLCECLEEEKLPCMDDLLKTKNA